MPSKDPDPWVMAQLQQAHLLQATYADRIWLQRGSDPG